MADYLRASGLLGTGHQAPVITRLTGGVSGETLLIEAGERRLVVKRALRDLLVDGAWSAKPERAMTEAAAITLLHGMTPHRTPELLDADPRTNTIVMSAAPTCWVPWKEALLGEVPDPTPGPVATASELGSLLGAWHRGTWHDQAIAARFNDYEAFDQLRISPFHRAVAAAHPAASGAIQQCLDELLTRRDCLVHGDFSPKNVLVGSGGLMVVDFEVAHMGAAVFDLAFMSCHLMLKALHLPHMARELAAAAARFVRAYQKTAHARPGPDDVTARLDLHTACLLLARVDGLSPVGYIDARTAESVRRVALGTLIPDPYRRAPALWDRACAAIGGDGTGQAP